MIRESSALLSMLCLVGALAQPCILAEDQPVKDRDVGAAPPALPGLVLPAGTRAVALKVEPVAANAFILPGVRVDVQVARPKEKKVVLQNLLVVAVESSLAQPPVEGELGTVTLAMTPAQVTRLALAMKGGTIRLIVRAPAGR